MLTHSFQNVWPNSTNKVPGPFGVGLAKALDGYAKWFTEVELPGCKRTPDQIMRIQTNHLAWKVCESYGYFTGEYNTGCLQNLNASNPIYHDLSVGNAGNRQWNWMLCNEP